MVDLIGVDLVGAGRAQAVRVQAEGELDDALDALGIPRGPVVLQFGGAGKLGSAERPRLLSTSAVGERGR